MVKIIEKYEEKIKQLKRIRVIVKEKIVFKPYIISRLDREILLNFDKVPSNKLAKRLNVNRSYIYATIHKFNNIYTRNELKRTWLKMEDENEFRRVRKTI